MSEALYDAVIVGGGPAGLSAALILGRCRRRVLVVDEGRPRNAASHALHGYLSRDGMCPAEFLEVSRQQLAAYDCVRFERGRVGAIERGDKCFKATSEDGREWVGRMILLATGLVDILPEIQGIRDFYGTSVHPCPLCDGWEHRDKPLAVLGADGSAVGLAEELMLWSKDVVLCTNGEALSNNDDALALRASGVQIEERQIRCMEGSSGSLERIVFTDGSALARAAAFFFPSQYQRSDLAQRLGCRTAGEEPMVECAQDGCSSIPGVYVIGNSSGGVQLIIAAAAEGMYAAVAINNALLDADSAAKRS